MGNMCVFRRVNDVCWCMVCTCCNSECSVICSWCLCLMLLATIWWRGPTEGACSMAVPAMGTRPKTSALRMPSRHQERQS